MKDLDPRAKLFWAFIWMINLFIIYSSIGQLVCLLLTLLLIRINKVKVSAVTHSIRYLLFFLPVTFLVHVFVINRGWQLFTGDMKVTPTLFDQPLMFTVRVANMIFLMGFVLKWVRDTEFLDAVYHFLKPLRRLGWQIDDFFQTIFIAVKFFPILQDEYKRLDEGWKIFTGNSDNRLTERVRRVGNSLIPLMIFSFQRAGTLADAISVRGYSNSVQRSYYHPLKFQMADWLCCGLAVGLLSTIIIWV